VYVSEGTTATMAFIKFRSFYNSLAGAINLPLSAQGMHGSLFQQQQSSSSSETNSEGSPFSRFAK